MNSSDSQFIANEKNKQLDFEITGYCYFIYKNNLEKTCITYSINNFYDSCLDLFFLKGYTISD